MLIAVVGVLIFVSSDESRWSQFKQPLHATLVDSDKRWLRLGLLVVVPVLLGFETYQQARPRVDAPIELRSIHPAPPGQISFRGKAMQLSGLENPLRHTGSMADHLREGRRVYYQNCIACHGDHLDGQGHFAHGFSPSPANFSDNGTIAQLTESYVFWRIAKGGDWTALLSVAKANSPAAAISTRMPETTTARKILSISDNAGGVWAFQFRPALRADLKPVVRLVAAAAQPFCLTNLDLHPEY